MVPVLFRACGCEGGGQIESGQENSEDVEEGDGQYAPTAPPQHHTTIRGKNNRISIRILSTIWAHKTFVKLFSQAS